MTKLLLTLEAWEQACGVKRQQDAFWLGRAKQNCFSLSNRKARLHCGYWTASYKLNVQLNQYLQFYTLIQAVGKKVCILIIISDDSTTKTIETKGKKKKTKKETFKNSLGDSEYLAFR